VETGPYGDLRKDHRFGGQPEQPGGLPVEGDRPGGVVPSPQTRRDGGQDILGAHPVIFTGRIRYVPVRALSARFAQVDDSARPVMARFRFTWDQREKNDSIATVGSRIFMGGTFGATAHMDGTYDWDGLQPGRYVLQINGSRDDIDPTFTRVGALPRRVELVSVHEPTEIVVHMVPVRGVLLRSRCAAEEWFRWEIRTDDDLPVTTGDLLGHAPRSLELPPGNFVLRVRAKHEDAVQAERAFEIDDRPVVIELGR